LFRSHGFDFSDFCFSSPTEGLALQIRPTPTQGRRSGKSAKTALDPSYGWFGMFLLLFHSRRCTAGWFSSSSLRLPKEGASTRTPSIPFSGEGRSKLWIILEVLRLTLSRRLRESASLGGGTLGGFLPCFNLLPGGSVPEMEIARDIQCSQKPSVR
jgi:hypothetical protein